MNTPLDFAANDAANPRWFIGVIGLTQQAYVTWNWSQGVSGTATYQFVRGGFDGGGYAYRVLGDSRAILMSNVPEPATATTAAGLMVLTATRLLKRGWRQRGPTAPS